MNTLSNMLFNGALLGEVVESFTGHDVSIQRSASLCVDVPGCSAIRCSHSSRAYSGQALVGVAEVIWEGTRDVYTKLLQARMKNYLRDNHVRPTNQAYDEESGILCREFMLKSVFGTLQIHEKLFLRNIQGLSPGNNGANGNPGLPARS